MALYAAYGSNMDPSHMLQRCPSSPVAGTGWLPGWRLTFGGEDLSWDGAMSMVVEDPDSAVFVVLYDMADSDERTLDSWEGADLGLYSKIRLRVHTLEGDVLAWLYALQGVHPQPDLAVQPEVGALPRVEGPLVRVGHVVEHHEDRGVRILDHHRHGAVPTQVLAAGGQPPARQPAGAGHR